MSRSEEKGEPRFGRRPRPKDGATAKPDRVMADS